MIQCSADAAVIANNINYGYQFWIYDPNGNYSRRYFQSTMMPGSAWPSATPAVLKPTYLSLGSFNTTVGCIPVIPQFKLLNVRVRSKLGLSMGQPVWSEFGPACTIKIDPLVQAFTSLDVGDFPAGSTVPLHQTAWPRSALRPSPA